MAAPDIAARDSRLGTLALQHPGSDRLAVRQYLIRAERGVAGADELSLLAGRERDPLPVVELAVRGPSRWGPIAVDDVAAGPKGVDHAADIARRRDETSQLVHLAAGRC